MVVATLVLLYMQRVNPASRETIGLYLCLTWLVFLTYTAILNERPLVSCLKFGVQNNTCRSYDVLC